MSNARSFENVKIIGRRYKVIKLLSQNTFGTVYLVKDIKQEQKFIAKLFMDYEQFEHEQKVMRAVKGKRGFPQLHDIFYIGEDEIPVIVASFLGTDLRQIIRKYYQPPSQQTISSQNRLQESSKKIIQNKSSFILNSSYYDNDMRGGLTNDKSQNHMKQLQSTKQYINLGKKEGTQSPNKNNEQMCVLKRLKVLHNLGYVHCDLKPDNIIVRSKTQEEINEYCYGLHDDDDDEYFVLQSKEKTSMQIRAEAEDLSFQEQIEQNKNTQNKKELTEAQPLVEVSLIDFGISHSYLKENGNHMSQPQTTAFKGSLLYCSINLIKGQYPSRRDDIESLVYVILNLINGKPSWVKYPESMRKVELISYLKQLRLLKTINDYGQIIPQCILEIYQKVRKLQFSEKPQYEEFINLIQQEIQDLSCLIVPIDQDANNSLEPQESPNILQKKLQNGHQHNLSNINQSQNNINPARLLPYIFKHQCYNQNQQNYLKQQEQERNASISQNLKSCLLKLSCPKESLSVKISVSNLDSKQANLVNNEIGVIHQQQCSNDQISSNITKDLHEQLKISELQCNIRQISKSQKISQTREQKSNGKQYSNQEIQPTLVMTKEQLQTYQSSQQILQLNNQKQTSNDNKSQPISRKQYNLQNSAQNLTENKNLYENSIIQSHQSGSPQPKIQQQLQTQKNGIPISPQICNSQQSLKNQVLIQDDISNESINDDDEANQIAMENGVSEFLSKIDAALGSGKYTTSFNEGAIVNQVNSSVFKENNLKAKKSSVSDKIAKINNYQNQFSSLMPSDPPFIVRNQIRNLSDDFDKAQEFNQLLKYHQENIQDFEAQVYKQNIDISLENVEFFKMKQTTSNNNQKYTPSPVKSKDL
eukprot:403337839